MFLLFLFIFYIRLIFFVKNENFVSESMTAKSRRPHPKIMRMFMDSPSKTAEKTAPKTDSVERRSAAVLGDRYF